MVGRIRIRIHFVGESGFSGKLDVNVKERGVMDNCLKARGTSEMGKAMD